MAFFGCWFLIDLKQRYERNKQKVLFINCLLSRMKHIIIYLTEKVNNLLPDKAVLNIGQRKF